MRNVRVRELALALVILASCIRVCRVESVVISMQMIEACFKINLCTNEPQQSFEVFRGSIKAASSASVIHLIVQVFTCCVGSSLNVKRGQKEKGWKRGDKILKLCDIWRQLAKAQSFQPNVKLLFVILHQKSVCYKIATSPDPCRQPCIGKAAFWCLFICCLVHPFLQ